MFASFTSPFSSSTTPIDSSSSSSSPSSSSPCSSSSPRSSKVPFSRRKNSSFLSSKSVVLWSLFVLASGLVGSAEAATRDEWVGRSIYQIVTDRFAPPSDTAPALTTPLAEVCDVDAQTWCGGTWRSIIDKLDYIQDMGMTAIWISPVQQNYDGLTAYNFAYHGYWVTDQRVLNPRFGSAEDLMDLSDALHERGMFLMVDIVVNNVPSTDDPETSVVTGETLAAHNLWFTDPAMYHPYCAVDYSNATSAEYCWLGDRKLALIDVNTEHPTVVTQFEIWIKDFVATYKIDGLRIDAAKHVPEGFWPPFCEAAGVFCIGEVFGEDLPTALRYASNMDSIMNYPVYYGMMDAFQLPGPSNISSLVSAMTGVNQTLPDTHVLGTFMENHDLPRFANTTVDPQSIFTALAFTFVTDGIPIVYYGQEQGFHGIADPSNREALWPSNYENTTTVQRIGVLNSVRAWMNETGANWRGQTFNEASATILSADDKALAIRKGPMLSILTSRGSPPVNESFAIYDSGWDKDTVLIDIFSCEEFIVGSANSFVVNYGVRGGRPVVTLPLQILNGSGICTTLQSAITATSVANSRPSSGGIEAKTHLSLLAALLAGVGGVTAMLFL